MAGIDHGGRGHALLSASGASRWLNCTPSARLESKVLEETTSIYAQEGTFAHEYAELKLRKEFFKDEVNTKTYISEEKKLKTQVIKLMGSEDSWKEMEQMVSKYFVFVMEAYNIARKRDPDVVIALEETLDYSHIAPEGFGTGDTTIIGGNTLEIIDLKYGKGIQVDAEGNPQLKLYGLGALREYDMYYDIEIVKMTIIQPRLDHYSSLEMSVEDLIAWGETEAKPRAQLAFAGKGEKAAGSWCRFCKVKAMCRTLADKNLDLAKHDFKEPDLMTVEEILEIYEQVPMLVDWANSLGPHLLSEALKEVDIPGYKVVEGRSRRSWVDEKRVRSVLRKANFKASEYAVSKLQGIPHVEKLLGKDMFDMVLDDLVYKPPGAPTLVPESDKRPVMGLAQAKRDFGDPLEEN